MKKNSNKKLWFRAKRYGWGWYPVSWEGWVITILYVIAIVQFAIQTSGAHSGSDALFTFAVEYVITTIFLLIICYARGEMLGGWRWGGKK